MFRRVRDRLDLEVGGQTRGCLDFPGCIGLGAWRGVRIAGDVRLGAGDGAGLSVLLPLLGSTYHTIILEPICRGIANPPKTSVGSLNRR